MMRTSSGSDMIGQFSQSLAIRFDKLANAIGGTPGPSDFAYTGEEKLLLMVSYLLW